MNKNFMTIHSPQKGFYSINSSKFHSNIYPINSLKEVRKIFKELKIKHYKAAHICYAYRIKDQSKLDEFYTDGGEPKGSSGLPILNELKKFLLINVSIYVIRYFGGKKLGIPGLIEAYSYAAKNSIENIELVEWNQKVSYNLQLPYEFQNIIYSILSKVSADIVKQSFNDLVYLKIIVNEKNVSLFFKMIEKKGNGKIRII